MVGLSDDAIELVTSRYEDWHHSARSATGFVRRVLETARADDELVLECTVPASS